MRRVYCDGCGVEMDTRGGYNEFVITLSNITERWELCPECAAPLRPLALKCRERELMRKSS
jgi:hypothetical protein